MKKYSLILLISLLFLVGCSNTDNSQNAEDKNDSNVTEKIETSLSKDSNEKDLQKFMLEIMPKAEELSKVILNADMDYDQNDTFEYQPKDAEASPVEMGRVADSSLTLANLTDRAKEIFSEEIYVNWYRPALYDLGIREPRFVEKDGKLYVSLFNSYTPHYEWDFDNIEILYATDDKIAFFADSSINFTGEEDQASLTRGKVVLVKEDGKWKLGTNTPNSDAQPFNEFLKEYYGDDILSSREEAIEAIRQNAPLQVLNESINEYIIDFDESFGYTMNLDGSYETMQMVWARLYEIENGKLKLVQKAQVGAQGYVVNFSYADTFGFTDNLVTTDFNFANISVENDAAENIFGYLIGNLADHVTPEDYYTIISNVLETDIVSDDVVRETLSEDFKDFMIIVPKFVGTKITIYDSEGEPRRIISDDSSVVIGKHKDIAKVKVEWNDQEVTFKPNFDEDVKIKYGTYIPISFG